MRTILLLFITILLFQQTVFAKDYIDIHALEINYAQKYGSVNKYFATYSEEENSENNIELKDPIKIKVGDYDEKVLSKFENKLKKDEIERNKVKKYIYSKNIYKTYRDDFYFIYRVAEKIIRANNLDFVNWRIVVDRTKKFNANSSELNCITLHSGLIDTFKGNDDALAFVIGHEIAHSVLGHQERLSQMKDRVDYDPIGVNYCLYLKNSKFAELAADIESAKLILRAGYDLEKAREAISVINTMDYYTKDFYSTHPKTKKRVKNFDENIKYFYTDEWIKEGKYNTINSEVLKCDKSTYRKSFVILRNELKDREHYYKPETKEDFYRRIAHMSYKNKEMKKSHKYFKKLTKINKEDFVPYLYLSYIAEYNYKKTNKNKFIKIAKKYIDIAYSIDNKNKYIINQKEELNKY